jgi:G:T-mismatch repair DNA endonuclease (very short patch repair protein)
LVKKQNSMMCIETSFARFLDIINFIAPGYSYARYLKAFKCEQEKVFFPYEWMDSFDKLDHIQLPPKYCFYNALKKEHISVEDYCLCQTVWYRENMQTFRDFLVWYNNLDVAPFIVAIDRQQAIYRSKGIDMLKDAISLPGLAIKWMFIEAPQPTHISRSTTPSSGLAGALRDIQPIMLIDEPNKDLYHLIKSNIVGGPSIVFHRFHEAGLTRIRLAIYGVYAKLCQLVLGLDASALYLWCLMQPMPTGYPRRRRIEHEFRPDSMRKFSKTAQGWLEHLSWTLGLSIRHALKGGEVRLGNHGLPVDGFCAATNTVYQFNGCLWHGHKCSRTRGIKIHPTNGRKMTELYDDTLAKNEYLREIGYTVVVQWECEWEEEVSMTPEIKTFLSIFFRTLYPPYPKKNLEALVNSIRDGSFFGFIECDISVPAELKERFSEMGPIFKNVNVSREHLSEHMRAYAEISGDLARPQRMLIGSLFGEKVLLLSTLARWYLDHGMVITKIYQLVDYTPRCAFERFGESVSNARRLGDEDPDKELLASTSKLVGNSAYGKTITNKEKHRNVKYADGCAAASTHIRSNKFVSMEEIDDEFYEIVTQKRQVSVPLFLSTLCHSLA